MNISRQVNSMLLKKNTEDRRCLCTYFKSEDVVSIMVSAIVHFYCLSTLFQFFTALYLKRLYEVYWWY